MEKKNQQERKWKKFFRAISISIPIQSIRRISTLSRSPSPAKPRSSNPTTSSKFRTIDVPISKPAGESIRINFDYSNPSITKTHVHDSIIEPKLESFVEGKKPNTALGAKLSGSKAEPAKIHVKKLESKKSLGGMQMEERFSNYIKQAKLKLRAITKAGDSNTESETSETEGTDPKYVNKDKFAEYIKRAKMKIRMSSSAGSGSQSIESSKYFKD